MNKLGGIMWRIRRISLGVCLFVCVWQHHSSESASAFHPAWKIGRITVGNIQQSSRRKKRKKNMENIDIKMPQICINIPQNVNIWRRSITICKSPTNITVALVWTMLDRLQIIDYSYISNECSTFLSIIIVHCDSIDFLHSAANHFNHFSTSVNNHSTLF